MIGLVVLFLIPIYYIAKSKGYNAVVVCVVSGLIGYFTPMMLPFFGKQLLFPYADCTLPLIVLIVVWMLPAKKGAPGKAYLTITFNCPECKASVSFARHEEGKAVLCPACGELITVPEDEYSPKHEQRAKIRPPAVEGEVCFDNYGNEAKALHVQALLKNDGIESEIIDGTGTGVLPQLGGFSVMISAEDWDRAIAIEEEADKNGSAVQKETGKDL